MTRDELCRNVVGPVWKLDGESWICELPLGHEGDHAAGDTWWTDPPILAAIVCHTNCYPCMFDSHHSPPRAHTWMAEDDAQHAGHPWPLPPEIAAKNQCACRCAKGATP